MESFAGLVHLRVRDTGVGIGPDFLPHLFDEFRQESTGLGRTHEGSGLGPAITRRLVRLMEGEISVQSVKGEGSVFTVTFPTVMHHEPEPEQRTELPAQVREDGTKQRLLLVEDNPETAFLVLHLLLDACDVTLALNGEEALLKAKDRAFDAVLLDINLGPGDNGTDVLHRLRHLSGYEKVPVAALTAYALPGDRERFLNLGFDSYLSKPFTVDGLLGLTTRLMDPHLDDDTHPVEDAVEQVL